jgi:hypothetical protein
MAASPAVSCAPSAAASAAESVAAESEAQLVVFDGLVSHSSFPCTAVNALVFAQQLFALALPAVVMVKVVASAMMEEARVGTVVNPVEKVVVTANSNIAVFPFSFCCSALHALSKPS